MECTVPSCMVEVASTGASLAELILAGSDCAVGGLRHSYGQQRDAPAQHTLAVLCVLHSRKKTICTAQAWHVLLLCLNWFLQGMIVALVGGLRHFYGQQHDAPAQHALAVLRILHSRTQ